MASRIAVSMRAVLPPVLLLMAPASSAAEFQLLRYDDDFVAQGRPCGDARAWACWKHRPVGEGMHASLGGSLRWRYEYIHNPEYGAAPQDRRGAVLQRYAVFADLQGEQWRGFAQIAMSRAHGRAAGPSPVDANRLDLTNLFGEWRGDMEHGETLGVRAGIQELRFGSGRLIDVRDGPNVRRSFEAVRAWREYRGARVDLIVAAPREHRPGRFDDRRLDSQALRGVYATVARDDYDWDVYLLHYEDHHARFAQGVAHERRWSLGTRHAGHRGAWSWNWELMAQGGHHGDATIRAWSVATDTAYTVDAGWEPQVALLASIASGDRDPDDDRLHTFNPMYPRGNYFGDDATLGPRNFFNLQPVLRLRPTPTTELSARVDLFWRYSTQDGVYAPNGRLVRAPGGSDARHVATIASLGGSWTLAPGWTADASFAYFRPGRFLRETGAHAPLRHTEMTLEYRF